MIPYFPNLTSNISSDKVALSHSINPTVTSYEFRFMYYTLGKHLLLTYFFVDQFQTAFFIYTAHVAFIIPH